jgi:hypothetical protein
MKNKLTNQKQHFILYTSTDGKVDVDVVLKDETVWLTQKAMGQLFGVESHTITYHLKEIYMSGELDEKATTRKIRVVQNEGKRKVIRNLDFYNLDAIISVKTGTGETLHFSNGRLQLSITIYRTNSVRENHR